jgi:guanylate kinase
MKAGKLVIFSAPSGAGKTTLVRHLMQSDLNLAFSVSATSRNRRANEKHGTDYYFLTPAQFKERIQEDQFLEWEEVYKDIFYGTLKSEVNRIWKENKHVIFDVDVVGGLNIKKQFGARALSVFVMPPTPEHLEARLRGRSTETEEELNKRLAKAQRELSFSDQFDVLLVNDDLSVAKKEAVEVVSRFLSA